MDKIKTLFASLYTSTDNQKSQYYFVENDCENIIIEKSCNVVLPQKPTELYKFTIINLGETPIKIKTMNASKIYNPFYSPTGNTQITIQKNNAMVFFFVQNSKKDGFWFCN